MSSRSRASTGATKTQKGLGALLAGLLVVPGCLGSKGNSNVITFRTGLVAIPHALYDPSAADAIARTANYGAWVVLELEAIEPLLFQPGVLPEEGAS
jgi:hypothetical protein